MTIDAEWTHTTASIPEPGLDTRRSASEAQRREIAAVLDLVGLDRLDAAYRIEHIARGRFRLSGEIRARVIQACVVTLDPVVAEIRELFQIDFWPAEAIPDGAEGERAVLGEDPPEPIEQHRIGVGRIVYDTLAAALDPYPRLPEAAIERHEAKDETPASAHPFAALAKLKRPAD